MVFDPSEDDGTVNWRGVRLPRRRVCAVCGITQMLAWDLSDYPHVMKDMADHPTKVVGLLA